VLSLIIGIVLILIGLTLAYALVLRPWLKNQAWAQRFFAWAEPAELALFKKSETVLVGRLVWLGGLIVGAYDGFVAYFSSMNVEPLTTRIMDFAHIPQDLRGLTLSAAVTGLGLAIVRLRKKTTKPIELVAVSDAKTPPAAAQAMAQAEVAKDNAVQAVAEAKT
jgi:hypothetical protein